VTPPTYTLTADDPRHRQALAYLVRLHAVAGEHQKAGEARAALDEFRAHHKETENAKVPTQA